MLTIQPEISATRLGDRIESIYVQFMPGRTAHETIAFQRSDGARLLVDVDERDLPIALQIIESLDAPDLTADRPTREQVQQAVDILFGFANQMVAYHRANQQARGNALIKKALEQARFLADPDAALAS